MEAMLQDNFSEHSGDKLTLVGDAAVHLNNYAASSACQLHAKRYKKRCVSQPLERQALLHSYRHELETFYLALQDADGQLKKTHHITQYMDCETAIKALVWPSYKPGHTMVTDTNLIMARAWLKSTTQHTVIEEWVM